MKLRQRHRSTPTARQRMVVEHQQAPAYSYLARRDARAASADDRKKSQALSLRRRLTSTRFWMRRSGLLLLIVVALVCLVRVASLSSNPRIVLSQSSSAALFRSPSVYEQAAQAYLKSSFWNRNKLTIDTGAASRQLQQKFPELAGVTITLPLMSERPVYYLELSPPVFSMQTTSGSFVLDDTGRVLAARDSLPGPVSSKLTMITDQTGMHAQVGQQVLSGQNVRFMQIVVAELASQQVKVSGLTLPAGSAQEVDVHVAGQSFYGKFAMQTSDTARQQAGTYLAVIHNLQAQHKVPTQYIDVRVAGRAYYL